MLSVSFDAIRPLCWALCNRYPPPPIGPSLPIMLITGRISPGLLQLIVEINLLRSRDTRALLLFDSHDSMYGSAVCGSMRCPLLR